MGSILFDPGLTLRAAPPMNPGRFTSARVAERAEPTVRRILS